jgi:hypothetical protein
MKRLRLEHVDETTLRLAGIDPLVATCLQEVPETLAQRDSPPAHRRLYPNPTTDPEINEDWSRFVTPELQHLFTSAGEILSRDLNGLARQAKSRTLLQVSFPAAHAPAWMCALNQARLILGELHGLTEADMSRDQFDIHQPRDLAILKVHLLGYVLHLFIELESDGTGTRP